MLITPNDLHQICVSLQTSDSQLKATLPPRDRWQYLETHVDAMTCGAWMLLTSVGRGQGHC